MPSPCHLQGALPRLRTVPLAQARSCPGRVHRTPQYKEGLPPREGATSPLSLSCIVFCHLGFFGCSDSKEPAHHEGDPCLVPGLGRCPGDGNGNPLRYFCLGNPMNRGAWWATVHGVTRVVHS